MAAKKKTTSKAIEAFRHSDSKRKNIPTAEHRAVVSPADAAPIRLRYPRNTDLDPQLVWRGKDQQDWSDLVVSAPPLYIQEKVHPKVLIDDLVRRSKDSSKTAGEANLELFGDFNGMPEGADKTEFYKHDQNWTNRMILGDSLQVMASLAEREGLRGKVQCIYLDPPYGIKFNSNFQWSTATRDVKDGKPDHITREPEQVRAFRDTWRDGLHSYLTVLRDRLAVARDLLTESGSLFVQIGEENVHRIRSVMEEVLGASNFVSQIAFVKTTGKASGALDSTCDYILWFAKSRDALKFRKCFEPRTRAEDFNVKYVELADGRRRAMTREEMADVVPLPPLGRAFRYGDITSARSSQENDVQQFAYNGRTYSPGRRTFSTNNAGLSRIGRSNRLFGIGASLTFVRYFDDFVVTLRNNLWTDTGLSGFGDPKLYVVQTVSRAIERCVLMTTDPGDLVLDPTCGSGTSAAVAEQWGRRWITIDTSRVALALARARIMGARYPYYLLADSRDGQQKEAEVTRTVPSTKPTFGNIRQGFVYERVPHITLKSIANNTEIDVIWDRWQATLEPLRERLNSALKKTWQDWEIPRDAESSWPDAAAKAHAAWWDARISRQQEIDKSIAAKAEFEYLYDKPYEDKSKVRVAGPFTVESLSPHRMLVVNEDDELVDIAAEPSPAYSDQTTFADMILENLKTAGVQQAHKEDKIVFTSLTRWPGDMICAEGRYLEGNTEKRAGILIGPEFGTVQRNDLVEAAREAGEAGFHVVISCAFNYDAHATEFNKLGSIPVLKARMNADLHMAEDLKNTGKGNLFVIFGEPDIDLITEKNGQLRVKVNGVDVFHPQTGEVRSDGPDGIACWFVDTDYNEESFFVRHAYFLGANDPYKSLKTTLKAEVDEEAWSTLNSDTSRPFDKPKGGRIAVKVINHLGDEVMKVFKV